MLSLLLLSMGVVVMMGCADGDDIQCPRLGPSSCAPGQKLASRGISRAGCPMYSCVNACTTGFLCSIQSCSELHYLQTDYDYYGCKVGCECQFNMGILPCFPCQEGWEYIQTVDEGQICKCRPKNYLQINN